MIGRHSPAPDPGSISPGGGGRHSPVPDSGSISPGGEKVGILLCLTLMAYHLVGGEVGIRHFLGKL